MDEVSRPRLPTVSVVIPTFRREGVLVDTIGHLLRLNPPPGEILIVDQSPTHEPQTEIALREWDSDGSISWIRLPVPSITRAMNVGLLKAQGETVLFLDDDIVPGSTLVGAHAFAHRKYGCNIVAGQVLQPGESVSEERIDAECSDMDLTRGFAFSSNTRREIGEMMGGNCSVNRRAALALGGFDENFVHVAYRFEAEFCDRAISAGEKILFEPAAGIRHLKAGAGGTRSFGDHLRTFKPSHAVGAYYFLMRARNVKGRYLQMALRPMRAVRTRHHLLHPWWIPLTLVAEIGGFFWAVFLFLRGPRLIHDQPDPESGRGP